MFEVAKHTNYVAHRLELFCYESCLLPSGFAPDDKGKNRTDNLNVLPTVYGFSAVLTDLKLLLVDKVYVTNVLGNPFSLLVCSTILNHLCRCMTIVYLLFYSGYIAYNFVLGAYSYWGPKAGYNIYKMVIAHQKVLVSMCEKVYMA